MRAQKGLKTTDKQNKLQAPDEYRKPTHSSQDTAQMSENVDALGQFGRSISVYNSVSCKIAHNYVECVELCEVAS